MTKNEFRRAYSFVRGYINSTSRRIVGEQSRVRSVGVEAANFADSVLKRREYVTIYDVMQEINRVAQKKEEGHRQMLLVVIGLFRNRVVWRDPLPLP